jgi:hypothetical protein
VNLNRGPNVCIELQAGMCGQTSRHATRGQWLGCAGPAAFVDPAWEMRGNTYGGVVTVAGRELPRRASYLGRCLIIVKGILLPVDEDCMELRIPNRRLRVDRFDLHVKHVEVLCARLGLKLISKGIVCPIRSSGDQEEKANNRSRKKRPLDVMIASTDCSARWRH